MHTKIRIFGLMFVAFVALAGCEQTAQVTSPAPAPRPTGFLPVVTPRAYESRVMQDYLAKVQQGLVTQGLLRTDGGGPDVPFSRRDLVENFIRVALYDEYIYAGGRLIDRETPSRLRRWQGPVRIAANFGSSVPVEQREKDRGDIAAYARRLGRLTRQPISAVSADSGNPNFFVFILNEDERRNYSEELRRTVPGLSAADAASILEMPRSTLCHVFAFSGSASPYIYDRAVAIIRGEHPNLTRLSCIHEELAQGLGLANDSPDARPSIFNDDEEFGLLTNQDELLLRMLYDRRLKPGMTPQQARPIVEQIVRELLPGDA
ncbi:MAG: DUF2927 domain-containing protein [Halocynthiibacter sp.]